MKNLVSKFIALEKEISNERGDFDLFALFLRGDAPDKWDLIVAARWFGTNDKKTLGYLAKRIRSHLKPQELLTLSRIVVLNPPDPAVSAIQSAFKIEHGSVEVRNSNFFGLLIKHAFIITSKKVPSKKGPAAT